VNAEQPTIPQIPQPTIPQIPQQTIPHPQVLQPQVGQSHGHVFPPLLNYQQPPGNTAMIPYYYNPLPTPLQQYHRNPGQVFETRMVSAHESSSPQFRNPEVYLLISVWLAALDNGPRGIDGHNFAQYTESFKANKIYRIHEIMSFTRSDILLIHPGMDLGTANALLLYAQEDVKCFQRMTNTRFGMGNIYS
jgi:hypothetical protein